jgi:hypothetical protein
MLGTFPQQWETRLFDDRAPKMIGARVCRRICDINSASIEQQPKFGAEKDFEYVPFFVSAAI